MRPQGKINIYLSSSYPRFAMEAHSTMCIILPNVLGGWGSKFQKYTKNTIETKTYAVFSFSLFRTVMTAWKWFLVRPTVWNMLHTLSFLFWNPFVCKHIFYSFSFHFESMACEPYSVFPIQWACLKCSYSDKLCSTFWHGNTHCALCKSFDLYKNKQCVPQVSRDENEGFTPTKSNFFSNTQLITQVALDSFTRKATVQKFKIKRLQSHTHKTEDYKTLFWVSFIVLETYPHSQNNRNN